MSIYSILSSGQRKDVQLITTIFGSVEEGARDVVTISAKAGSDGHSATFPIDLIQPRILSSCPPRGMVLDPFCGTGRVLTVAAANNRDAY